MNARYRLGTPPAAGDVVELDGVAGPEFARAALRLRLTEEAAASSVDLGAGRGLDDALWLLLTGWELDRRGQRVVIRTVSARRMGIRRVES